MRFVRFGYISAVAGGGVLALSLRYYALVADISRMRIKVADYQLFVEAEHAKVASRRQQLLVQQEKLAKGSAVGEKVGPAVLKDIVSLAERPANARLRELLQKHGVKVDPAALEPVGVTKKSVK